MYKKLGKRSLDIIFGVIGCICFAIAFIVVAPLIYLTDRGPVFYNATRRGKDGKEFKMYKFRSMMVNAPDLKNPDGSTYNSDNDPRLTKIGRLMRKTSVDELPQFINVLIGDMSMIGPRPTLATKPFSEVDQTTVRRYDVRPGVTGYSQAYFRNSITQSEKFEHDCYYVDNLSFMLDVKIFLKTLLSVVMRENIFVEQGKMAEKEKVGVEE